MVETTQGNEPSGRFMLQADTAPRGWPEHRSGWIYVGASPRNVEEAVIQISGVKAVDISVNASLPTIGPIAWTITFSHRQEFSKGPGDVSFVATGQFGNREPLRVVRSQVFGDGAQVETETIRDGDRGIGGMYEIYLQGIAGGTATVAAGASASSARTALVEGLGFPEATGVTRVGPLDDNLAYTWTVTLPKGMTLLSNVSSDVEGELAVKSDRLSGEGVFANIVLVRAGTTTIGGDFNVSFEGEGTGVSLPHNATNTEVANAISSLSLSGGNVSVSSEHIRDNENNEVVTGERWAVTFLGLAAAGDVPAIKINGSGLLTGTGVDTLVNETSKGISADVQKLTIAGYNGTFIFFVEREIYNETNPSTNSTSLAFSSPLAWDSNPSAIAGALLEVTGKRVYVERSSLASSFSSTGGYTWLVLFAEALSGTWGEVQLNTTGLLPNDSLLAGAPRQASLTSVTNSTVHPISGSFFLRFGQNCEERASGVYCLMAETSHIHFNSSTSQLEEALETLPAILDAAVSGSRYNVWDGVGEVAPDSYGVPSAGIHFRVTLAEVIFNASNSVVAEYWRRTWSPEDSATEWSGHFTTEGSFPLLDIDVSGMSGSHPTGRVEETTRGQSTNVGGVFALEVSQNAGRDYTSSGVTYTYEPLVSVDALVPDHGPIDGGTEVNIFCNHIYKA